MDKEWNPVILDPESVTTDCGNAIHRLAAVASRWDELVAPEWTREKMRSTQFIEDHLAAANTWQGRLWPPALSKQHTQQGGI